MSAPELPAIFGNYALGDFVEIASPAAVSWLPQTKGWLIVAALLALWLGRLAWRALKRWHHNRYRREALKRLAAMDAPSCQAINELLKLTALAGYPRTQVATLSGEPWVAFLNSECDAPPFDTQLTQLLALAPYRQANEQSEADARLRAASQAWINQHRGTAHA